MNNFEFKNPTKIIFGKDTIEKLKEEIPTDAKVLLLYGGGSIKTKKTIKIKKTFKKKNNHKKYKTIKFSNYL